MSVTPDTFPITPEVRRIGQAIREEGGRPVLVGGWVRDCVLGIPHSKDFDLEVYGMAPRPLQKLLRRFGPVHTVGRHFGVLKLATEAAEYDVSVPRRESKIGKGHKEFQVEPDPHMTFEEAAARRDFTINAMGYEFLTGAMLDPFGGVRDLDGRTLRHVGPAFGEDPLRVLRAMQFAGRFELAIVPETQALCRAQDLSELPQERIWEEVKKLLLQARFPSHGFAYAEALGVLDYFPEWQALAAQPDPAVPGTTLWDATLSVIDGAAGLRTGESGPDLEILAAALCHRLPELAREGEGPDAVLRRFLGRLTRETALPERVWALVRDRLTPGRLFARRDDPDVDGEVRRLALRVSIPHLLRLARAEHHAGGAEGPYAVGDWLADRARALGVFDGPPEPMVRGRHLMALGIKQGPHVGRVLDRVFERQLDGAFATRQEAIDWAIREGGLSVPDAAREEGST